MIFGLTRAFADIEIDLGDTNPAPAPKASNTQTKQAAQNAPQAIVATPTPVPESTDTKEISTEESKSDEDAAVEEQETNENQTEATAKEKPALEVAPLAVQAHGILKMRDVYEAGMKAYAGKDYEAAIRYLKESLTIHDPYTRKFYYAEANAMLGVIYQFYFPVQGHYHLAYGYYKSALKFERGNPTALRHLKEVRKYR